MEVVKFNNSLEEFSDKTTDNIADEAMQLWSDYQYAQATDKFYEYLSSVKDPKIPKYVFILRQQHMYSHLSIVLTIQSRYSESVEILESLTMASETFLNKLKEEKTSILEKQKILDSFKSTAETQAKNQDIEYLKKRLEILNEQILDTQPMLASYYHDLGKSLMALEENLESQKAFQKAYDIAMVSERMPTLVLGTIEANFSLFYENLGNYKVAQSIHLNSLHHNPSIDAYDHPHLSTFLHPLNKLEMSLEEMNLVNNTLKNLNELQGKEKEHEMMKNQIDYGTNPMGHELNKSEDSKNQKNQNDQNDQNDQKNQNDHFENKNNNQDENQPDLEIYFDEDELAAELNMTQHVLQLHQLHFDHKPLVQVPFLLRMGVISKKQKQFENAKKYFENAFEIALSSKGPNHCLIATIMQHMAILYAENSNLREAEKLMKQALKIKVDLLGSEHIHVSLIEYDLSLVYAYQFQFEDSFQLLQHVLQVFKSNLSYDHNYFTLVNQIVEKVKKEREKELIRENRQKLKSFNDQS